MAEDLQRCGCGVLHDPTAKWCSVGLHYLPDTGHREPATSELNRTTRRRGLSFELDSTTGDEGFSDMPPWLDESHDSDPWSDRPTLDEDYKDVKPAVDHSFRDGVIALLVIAVIIAVVVAIVLS